MYVNVPRSSKKLKSILFQKLFWLLTVRINCSSYLKKFQIHGLKFFRTVGQNNFGKQNTISIFFSIGEESLKFGGVNFQRTESGRFINKNGQELSNDAMAASKFLYDFFQLSFKVFLLIKHLNVSLLAQHF